MQGVGVHVSLRKGWNVAVLLFDCNAKQLALDDVHPYPVYPSRTYA